MDSSAAIPGTLIDYRRALALDAPAIAAIHAASWRVAYRGILRDSYLDGDVVADRLAHWQKRLEHPAPGQFVEIAGEGTDAVGFICAFADHDPRYGALIDNVHVLPSHAGRGIGTALLSHAFQWLSERDERSGVYLWAYEKNSGARRLYERLGATHVETISKPNPGGGSGRSCRYAWDHPRLR